MSKVVRATIYLKTNQQPKPYRTCYFTEREYDRLLKDLQQYQTIGSPLDGLYREDLCSAEEHSVFIEFSSVSHIKVVLES